EDEPETPKDRNEVISLRLLRYIEELPDLLRDLIIIYQKHNPRKIYPDLFISDLCLRFANLLNTLRKTGFNGSFVGGISYLQFNNERHSAYQVIAQGMGITNNNAGLNPQSEIATQNQDGEVSYYIIKSDVSSWLMKGFESGFEHLPSLSDKISYILSAVKIFGDIGYIRKQGFFLHYLGQILKEDFYTVCKKYNISVNPLRFGSPITYKSIIKTRINRSSSINSFSSNYRQSSYHVPTLPTHKEVNIDDPVGSDNNSYVGPIATEVETAEPEGMNNLLDYSDFNDVSFMSNAPQTPGNTTITEINILEALSEQNEDSEPNEHNISDQNISDQNVNGQNINEQEDRESVGSNHSNTNSIHTNVTNNTMATNTNTITSATTAINTTQVSNTFSPTINTNPTLLSRSGSQGEIKIASLYRFPMNNIVDIMKQACEFYGAGKK
ncbi:hypothetical protein PIROE2DRAFT_14310, partial [Piromyces sp. E2]